MTKNTTLMVRQPFTRCLRRMTSPFPSLIFHLFGVDTFACLATLLLLTSFSDLLYCRKRCGNPAPFAHRRAGERLTVQTITPEFLWARLADQGLGHLFVGD
jgi:hypothetical protein